MCWVHTARGAGSKENDTDAAVVGCIKGTLKRKNVEKRAEMRYAPTRKSPQDQHISNSAVHVQRANRCAHHASGVADLDDAASDCVHASPVSSHHPGAPGKTGNARASGDGAQGQMRRGDDRAVAVSPAFVLQCRHAAIDSVSVREWGTKRSGRVCAAAVGGEQQHDMGEGRKGRRKRFPFRGHQFGEITGITRGAGRGRCKAEKSRKAELNGP
ncbi:hypothetical protein DFP72DRAFT_855526 [Ephemerocybe angulata]|uniref:Uncharacterized protein n=1 Tax=Ephemerocybe angulata TaxID=980116 RepID=A0A8H6HIC7_9AGAR|nr:hypothetical protein DFP72DRAFT_855526 [Tulosesus angulatus]